MSYATTWADALCASLARITATTAAEDPDAAVDQSDRIVAIVTGLAEAAAARAARLARAVAEPETALDVVLSRRQTAPSENERNEAALEILADFLTALKAEEDAVELAAAQFPFSSSSESSSSSSASP